MLLCPLIRNRVCARIHTVYARVYFVTYYADLSTPQSVPQFAVHGSLYRPSRTIRQHLNRITSGEVDLGKHVAKITRFLAHNNQFTAEGIPRVIASGFFFRLLDISAQINSFFYLKFFTNICRSYSYIFHNMYLISSSFL